MGETTCHRLTEGQRSGYQGDQLRMHFPKVGVGIRRSETRLLSDVQPHTGETEARSSTSLPGSHSIRPQTSGSSRPRGGRESPGPRSLSSQQLPVHLPHSCRRRHRGESLEQKTQGAGQGRAGGGAEAIRGGGPARPSRPSSPGADGTGRRAPPRGPARPPAPAADAAAVAPATAAAGPGHAAAGECPPPAGRS